MGKTSLVNQVINQLQPRTVLFTQAFAVLAIWLVIHFVAKSLEWETLYIFLGIPAFVFVFWSNKLIDGFFSVVNRKYHNTEKEKAKHRQKDYQDGIKTWGARGLRILKRTWKKLSHFFILDMKYYKMSSVSKMLYFLIYGLMVEVLVRILSIDYNMNIGFITLFVFALVVGSHFNKYLAVGFPKVCPVEIRV